MGIAVGVLLIGGASATSGQDVGTGTMECPDERACNVDARLAYLGKMERCGLGLKIFGVGGAIWGEKCYAFEVLVPAHQECHGAPNKGTRCTKERDVSVKSRTCECGGGLLPFLDTGIPLRCVCSDWQELGTIEDFQTADC